MRLQWCMLAAAGLIAACSESEAPDDELNPLHAADIPRVASAREALDGAHVPTIDPMTLNDAEISKVLGAGPFCSFHYTSDGKPVLALKLQSPAAPAHGVVQVNGFLVPLSRSANTEPTLIILEADEIRMTLSFENGALQAADTAQPREAELVFEIDQKLRVGYGGYYVCALTST